MRVSPQTLHVQAKTKKIILQPRIEATYYLCTYFNLKLYFKYKFKYKQNTAVSFDMKPYTFHYLHLNPQYAAITSSTFIIKSPAVILDDLNFQIFQ